MFVKSTGCFFQPSNNNNIGISGKPRKFQRLCRVRSLWKRNQPPFFGFGTTAASSDVSGGCVEPQAEDAPNTKVAFLTLLLRQGGSRKALKKAQFQNSWYNLCLRLKGSYFCSREVRFSEFEWKLIDTSIFRRVLFDSKGWCIGTPYHPFSTLWKIQVGDGVDG